MSRINAGRIIAKENYQDSATWKYLHEEIDYILSNEINANGLSHPYISNNKIEERLKPLLKPSNFSRYYLLSGLTGSGKSTIMHHVFFGDKEATSPMIKKGNLIIPIDFDIIVEKEENSTKKSKEKEFENIFVNVISQAIVLVQDTFNIPVPTHQEFVGFFTKNATGFINLVENGKRKSFLKIRNDLYKDNTLYAMIAELCISLNHENSKINNVIFIIDNVESLGVHKTPIQIPLLVAHKTINFMCKKSVSCGKKVKWSPNILICCRHYVYRMMHTRDFEDGTISQIFESYCKPEKVDLDNPATLKEIIETRWHYIRKNSAKTKKNNTKWKTSMDATKKILENIIKECEIREGNFILDLNLSDIRSSLKTIKNIIYNKRWIQKDGFDDKGYFTIENASDFNIKQPYILRAIGMESGEYYNSEDNLIPNLLINSPNNDVNIFALLALKYFMLRSSSWDTPIYIPDFYSDVKSVFKSYWQKDSQKIKKAFENAIWILLNNRMLLRSADQEQKDAASITKTNFKKINYVYVSQAARDYWELLGDNSIIFEMIMDDVYLDTTKITFINENRSKYRLFNKIPFEVCLNYLPLIFDAEKNLIKLAFKNMSENKYFELFGEDLITKQLLSGVNRSFENYFREERFDEYNYKERCKNKIKNLQKEINNL